MEKRRVVVTGLGTVNPLGNTVAESWAAAKAGQCGIAPSPVRYRWVQVQTGG